MILIALLFNLGLFIIVSLFDCKQQEMLENEVENSAESFL